MTCVINIKGQKTPVLIIFLCNDLFFKNCKRGLVPSLPELHFLMIQNTNMLLAFCQYRGEEVAIGHIPVSEMLKCI